MINYIKNLPSRVINSDLNKWEAIGYGLVLMIILFGTIYLISPEVIHQ